MGIQRRVALIGSGQGPWISTQGLKEPRAKVTGLKPGGMLKVIMADNLGPDYTVKHVIIAEENGVFSLQEALWMRVACEGGGKGVICDILTKKAVA